MNACLFCNPVHDFLGCFVIESQFSIHVLPDKKMTRKEVLQRIEQYRSLVDDCSRVILFSQISISEVYTTFNKVPLLHFVSLAHVNQLYLNEREEQ